MSSTLEKSGGVVASPRASARPFHLPLRQTRRWKRYSDRTFYLFVAPWVLGFVALTAIPMLYALLVSLTNFDGISGRWRWVGLANYQEALHDPDAWYSLGRTALYTGLSVPLGVLGGLGLAVLLNQRVRAVGIFRTIFYLPSVVPIVAATVMWKLIFDRDTGALNALLERVGGPTVTWLIDPTAFYALLILVLWGLGGGMVIFLAGLQGVPEELREAAEIDGANPAQVFRWVTLPLLSPVIFFQVVIGVIYALQTLVQPYLLGLGGINSGSNVNTVPRGNFLYMVYVYQQMFAGQRFGYAAALLWLLFVLILGITLVFFRSSRFWVYYEVGQD